MSELSEQNKDWDLVIEPNESWRQNFSLAKIRAYRDLLIEVIETQEYFFASQVL